MIRHKFILVFPLLISLVSAQVHLSDAFKKTVERIARQRIRSEVIRWVTDLDPVSGIVARDLIAQVIDGKDEPTLIRSTTNVVSTMLFLGGMKGKIADLVEKNPEVVVQANKGGWSKDELLAYSCLYFYYSERLKYGYYVSPEILKMTEEKAFVESLSRKDERKWATVVSQDLIRRRRESLDISTDIRALEFVQFSLTQLLLDRENFYHVVDSAFASLLRAYEKEAALRELFESGRDPLQALKSLYRSYLGAYSGSYSADQVFRTTSGSSVRPEEGADTIRTSNVFARTFSSLVETGQYRFVESDQYRSIILGVLRDLMEYWMSQARQSGWRFEYTFSLAGSMIGEVQSDLIDFTVLDQIRIAKHWESSSFFIFIGGFIDPIIKNTLYKDGAKVYLAGVGYSYGPVYVSLSGAFPYRGSTFEEVGPAVTIGYKIPLDILE